MRWPRKSRTSAKSTTTARAKTRTQRRPEGPRGPSRNGVAGGLTGPPPGEQDCREFELIRSGRAARAAWLGYGPTILRRGETPVLFSKAPSLGSTYSFLIEHAGPVAFRGKDLDPVVQAVDHVHIALAIEGDLLGLREVARRGPGAAERELEVAVQVEDLYPVIPAVTDIEGLLIRGNAHIVRKSELPRPMVVDEVQDAAQRPDRKDRQGDDRGPAPFPEPREEREGDRRQKSHAPAKVREHGFRADSEQLLAVLRVAADVISLVQAHVDTVAPHEHTLRILGNREGAQILAFPVEDVNASVMLVGRVDVSVGVDGTP